MPIAEDHTEMLEAPVRLVADTRVEFRRAALDHLGRAIERNDVRVVVDLAQTREIDASGLGVLVLLQKRARERMIATRLKQAPAFIRQMLAWTQLDYLFELED